MTVTWRSSASVIVPHAVTAQLVILTVRVKPAYGAAIGDSSTKVVTAAPLHVAEVGAAVEEAEMPRQSLAGVATHCALRTCSSRWFARKVAVESCTPSWMP